MHEERTEQGDGWAFAMRRQRLEELIAAGKTFLRVALDHQQALVHAEPDDELVVFYENPRDPAISEALRTASERLNRRKLQRDDRRLRFAVEPPPAARERFD